MATGAEDNDGYSLANVGTLTLENTNNNPFYISIVVCQDNIIVLDFNAYEVQIYRLHHETYLITSKRLLPVPFDMCLMDAMNICVIHQDGLIKMMSIDSADMSRVLKTTRTIRLQGILDKYHGVVRFRDNLVVIGVKQDTIYWCIVSLDDGHVDTIQQICKGCGWSSVTNKDNLIYFACHAGDESSETGVYGFDSLNPCQCKYIYKHQRLQWPTSIAINDDGDIFVCNGGGYSCIHQLTSSCQGVAIFTQGIPSSLRAMFCDHGRLYVTCDGSRNITIHINGSSMDDVKLSSPHAVNDAEYCHHDHRASEVSFNGGGENPVQEIRIQRRVEEILDQAKILMSTKKKDLFIEFQRVIGTTLYFSTDPESLKDAQKNLNTTESFLKNHKPDIIDKWVEYRDQGKLTQELIDIIYAKTRNQKLHENKASFLKKMEKLNIIARARSFNENGVKEENYYFIPCVLRKESPKEVITPAEDPRMVSTSVLCWVITGKVLLPAIFQKLFAACLARWPVAKKKETSENLIFRDCTVFNLDLIHRLFLHCKNQAVFARITRMGIDKVNAKVCTRVRKFISISLSEIISGQDRNSNYMLCVQSAESPDIPEDIRSFVSPPFEMWFMDEEHDPDAPITPEHMNHARLYVALVTVCGNAMRAILLANIPVPHTNIYQAILANKATLTSRTQDGSGNWQNALLNKDQCKMLLQDPNHRYVAPIDQYDISLLYTLIRNISTVTRPSTDWGVPPQDSPRDNSLGANVERIRLYRNTICGHSADGQIGQQDFEDYWNKIDAVIHDIESVIGGQELSQELNTQKRQVISVYEAC